MDGVELGFEEYGHKAMENKTFGQNRMCICRDGSKGQTYGAAALKKKIVSKFDVHVTVQRDKFLIIKPTRCNNVSNFFWNDTLHVSDSPSVHHQEFFYCTHSNGICHTGLLTACEQDQDGTEVHPDPARKLHDIYHCCVYSEKLLIMDRGTV
jgi:hypothetical protein